MFVSLCDRLYGRYYVKFATKIQNFGELKVVVF